MTTPSKTSRHGQRANKQAGGPQQGTAGVGPRDPGTAGAKQEAGSPHTPQRFSQQQAQNIPSDPDPDDPVSP